MIPLNQIQVAAPCHESWDGMTGDRQVRFCAGCRQNVYNLSEMNAIDAQRLLDEKEGRLCVRFYRRADGTLLTKDCAVGVRARRKKTLSGYSWAAALMLAGLSGLLRPASATSVNSHGGTHPTSRVRAHAVKARPHVTLPLSVRIKSGPDPFYVRPRPLQGNVARPLPTPPFRGTTGIVGPPHAQPPPPPAPPMVVMGGDSPASVSPPQATTGKLVAPSH